MSVRMWVQPLVFLSGLRIQRWHKLQQCRSQMPLRSCVAVTVAMAHSCSSDSTPSLGTCICHRCGRKKEKKEKKKQAGLLSEPVSSCFQDFSSPRHFFVLPERNFESLASSFLLGLP